MANSGRKITPFGTNRGRQPKVLGTSTIREPDFRLINYILSNFADSAQVSDVLSFIYDRAFAETVNPTQVLQLAVSKIFGESLNTTDVDTLNIVQAVGETLSGLDSAALTVALGKSEALTASEGVVKVINTAKSDGATAADTFAKVVTYIRTFGETVNQTDSQVLTTSLVKADAVSKADSPVLTTSLVKADGVNADDLIGVPDGITYQFAMGKSESLTTSDNFVRVWTARLAPGDTADAADSPALNISKPLSDTVVAADSAISIGSLFEENPGDTLSGTSDASVISFGKNPSEALSAGDVFSRVVTYKPAFGHTADAADGPALALSKPFADSNTASDGFVLTTGQGFGDTADASESLVRTIAKALGDTADAEDLVGVPDGLTFTYAMTKADGASTAESLSLVQICLFIYRFFLMLLLFRCRTNI